MKQMNTSDLFVKRMQSSWNHALNMVKTIINGGGTPLLIGIFVIALYFGYRSLLEWLPKTFPVSCLLSFIFSLFLTSSRIRTWIQPADLVFLLSLEARMRNYFRASLLYSLSIHLIHLAIIMGFAYPLYRVSLGSSSEFAISFLLLAIIQVWNVLIHWHEIRLSTVRSSRWIWSSTFVRWLVNVVTTMVILEKVWTGLIALFPVLSLIFLYVQKITPAFPYPWAKLRDQEQRTLAKYYATARWFFDLPQVPTTIKRRKVLIQLLDRFLPKQQAFAYLYWRSFVRKSELFSIYLRLIVWVMFMTVILPYPWFIVFLYLLGLWLFAIQLPAIANHRLYPIWVRLYPISANEQTHTLKQMGFVLLGLQNVLYTLFLLLVNPLPFVVTIGLGIAGLGFNYLLSAFYLPGQIKKL